MQTDDRIDTSQWLPKGDAVLTPERRAQPDMLGEGATIEAIRVMHSLHQRALLNDEQLEHGQTYERWQMIYRAKRNGQRIRGRHSGLDDIGTAERGYGYLLIRMERPLLSVLDCCLLPSRPELLNSAIIASHSILDAFERLGLLLGSFQSLLDSEQKMAQNAVRDEGIRVT